MYNITAAKPNDVVVRCIRVTYTGTLPSTVRLYTTTPVNAFGQYVTLSIDKGTMPGATTFPNCTSFTSEANVFTGTLVELRCVPHELRHRRRSPHPARRPSGTQNDTSCTGSR